MSKKIVMILLAIAVFSSITQTCRAHHLSNESKKGVNVSSINRLLRLDESDVDIASAALLFSKIWGTNKNVSYYHQQIDKMAEEVIARLEEENVPRDFRALSVINDYLFNNLGFDTVDNADDPHDLFLHTVLDRRHGYCLSLSILYLGIGERIGLPIYGVVVPGHFFVRYDDGQRKINIETTSKGAFASDEHYIEKFNPPANDLYMKSLTARETIGCFFNNLGNCYLQAEELDNASYILELATQITPSLAEARANLGNIYLTEERYEEALEQYFYSLQINPDDAKVNNNIGNAYNNLGKLNLAIDYYRRALRFKPDFLETHKNIAIAYKNKREYDSAIKHLDKAAKLAGDDAEVFMQLGEVYRFKKDYVSAAENYLATTNLEPYHSTAFLGLAYCYLELDDNLKALRMFEDAIRIDGTNSNSCFGAAVACNKLGYEDQEIHYYIQTLDIDPRHEAALQNLGNAYFRNKMFAEAAEEYLAGLKVNPYSPEFTYNLALSYTMLDMLDKANDYYLETIKLQPRNGMAYNGLAINYFNLKDYKSSLEHLKLADKYGYKISEDLLDRLERIVKY